ncbi:MAG: carboxypeptidase regulatory-like domain-containing protein [Bryobacterales bacterium]|nr:carboxypeptidase regulatory-like domain-containing protein [Bryobacterales bacterium]
MMAGVKVIAINNATKVQAETITSSTGNYVIPNLQVGTYDVNASSPGFKSWTRTGIVLSMGDTIRIDPLLEVGHVSEQITISGAAPMLKTETTEVSSTMEQKLVGDMPVTSSGSWGMRSVFSVMLMMPQVRSNDGQSAWDDFMVGGGQGFAWQVSVDGASIETGFRNNIGIFNRLVPTLDAVEEAHIDTAAFKAEEPIPVAATWC